MSWRKELGYVFAPHAERGDLGRVVEWTGVSDRFADWVAACKIFGDGDEFFDLQIAVLAQRLKRLHIFPAADKECVVDRNQITAIIDQRADFVDQPRALVNLVHFASGCS